MPTPPKKDETEQEYVSRCIAWMTKNNEGKSPEQRAAICYSIYRNKDKKRSNMNKLSEQIKKIAEQVISKYKHINFKEIDRNKFEKIREEETQKYDQINKEAIDKSLAFISKTVGINTSMLKKEFKNAISKNSYSAFIIMANNLRDQDLINDKCMDFIKSTMRDFGKKMDKLNLDLVVDDKTLENEGFFKQYPHLKK